MHGACAAPGYIYALYDIPVSVRFLSGVIQRCLLQCGSTSCGNNVGMWVLAEVCEWCGVGPCYFAWGFRPMVYPYTLRGFSALDSCLRYMLTWALRTVVVLSRTSDQLVRIH